MMLMKRFFKKLTPRAWLKKGIIYIWTNKNLKSRKLEIKVREELGIEQKLLTQKEVLDLEPNLRPVFDAGVIYESAMHARDPHGILKKYLDYI